MSAPQDLHPTSAEFDSDHDLSFEVISESLPNDDIIYKDDISDSEKQKASGAVLVEEVEKMCSGLESQINALSVQLEESNMPMKKDKQIIKGQKNQLANLMAENEELKRAQKQLKDTVARKDVQVAEKEKEKAEVLINLDNVRKQRDEAYEDLKRLQTMYQELTEQSKQVKKKLNDDLVDYFFKTHGLKHSLAEQEAENEKNLRKLSNLKNKRNELSERLSEEVMVLIAGLNEMQAEHQRMTLENMELSEQKATLEQETLKNLAVIQDLRERRDKALTAKHSSAKELGMGTMFFEKSHVCSEIQNSIESLKKSKADCEAKLQALDHRNLQLEARIAERDEEKTGDIEEIRNLKKFKNELLEEMKAKECHANGQIEELTRINLNLEEQIRARDEVAHSLIEELVERKKIAVQELQALADEKKLLVEKYKKYKQIAHGYKKKCQELSEQSQLNRSIGNRADFEKQINGRWVLSSFRKSNGFSLPEKYHNWNKGNLVCELKDNRFTTSIHNGLMTTNMKHFVLETVSCFMTNEALFTVDYKTAPFGMVARHYFENGMLKIEVMVNNEIGVYTFIKAE